MRYEGNYYIELGFKCGLEVHQRLLTKEKLFCPCAADQSGEKLQTKIERIQRAVSGELGKKDKATELESMKKRKFIYNIYDKTACLVDIDEEPPHEINNEALEAAYLIAATFGAELPDEIEVMRKEVIDGSDPSAFQRTMLFGYGGFLSLGKKRINIPTIFLEEESSGIEENGDNFIIYNTDRLGIPLVEIDTSPEIENPDEAKEVATRIGMLLRLTGKVQRGIGTIRQDVNVSIKGGARVEIKGFQDLDQMDKIIDSEIERQINLIEISKVLQKRGAHVDSIVNVTELFNETNVKIIKEKYPKGAVLAAKLVGFKGIIGKEINPDTRLGSEISSYAKIAGVGGLIHSDEDLNAYGFTQQEIKKLSELLELSEEDAFILVAADEETAKKAMELALYRAEYAIKGVPKESRSIDIKKNKTKFMRLLPGGSRMYPETDVKPIMADYARYERLKSKTPDIEAIKKRLLKEIGNEQITEQLLKSIKLQDYFYIAGQVKAHFQVIAATLVEKMKELKRQNINVDVIDNETLVCMFDRYAKGMITKQAFEPILKALPKNCKEVDEIIYSKGLVRVSGEKLRKIVEEEAKGEKKDKDKLKNRIMTQHRLNVDGEELNRIIDTL
ncbi:MAG: Glu-tRNA(Gln) amidotransferase subunit GatE [Candidatus Micrarchaeia archaeon]